VRRIACPVGASGSDLSRRRPLSHMRRGRVRFHAVADVVPGTLSSPWTVGVGAAEGATVTCVVTYKTEVS
jgi:hypothetical protein